MINQRYNGTTTSRRFILLPVAVTAGQPLLIGKLPAVALDSYQANELGAVGLFGGTFNLTVIGQSDEGSPPTGLKINPGDPIYAKGGTLDPTTNVTTGFVLNGDATGVLFGNLDPSYIPVASGATDTAAAVLLSRGM